MKTKSEKAKAYEEKALGAGKTAESTASTRKSGILNEHMKVINGTKKADSEMPANSNSNQLEHDPNRIRAWHGHNRDYSALSESRCDDLIEGFQTSGQQFPAIVRKVNDSKDYDYEFICGARRHWTATHLKRDLLIEVRDLDDKNAFMLQDIENRDREDVSDYERAIDYKKALPIYFDGEAKKMADELHIEKGNFSRLLALADLPKPIVDAYGDIRELVVRHGSTYKKYLQDPSTAERVISAAKRCKGQNMKGIEVFKKLKAIAEDKKSVKSSLNKFSNKFIDVKEGQGGNYTVKFRVSEKTKAEEIRGIKQSLESMIKELSVKTEQDADTKEVELTG